MSWIVADVMTRDVVTVPPSASFEDCVAAMRLHGIGALPVVADGGVRGIVTRTDLLASERRPTPRERYAGVAAVRERSSTAGDVMTSRLVTVRPETPLAAAVRMMFQHRIDRLPVVDGDRRLVGIVSRSDVLRMFLRSDVAIRREVERSVTADMPFIGKGRVSADVADGVVTLKGHVEPGTLTSVLLRLVASVPGVVGVKNRLRVRRAARRG